MRSNSSTIVKTNSSSSIPTVANNQAAYLPPLPKFTDKAETASINGTKLATGSDSEGASGPLTVEESADLARCETAIEANKNAWQQTVAAISEIFEKRLYRAQFDSFKEYCEKRWHFTRSYGYRLLKAHQTVKEVSTMVDTSTLITSGSQAAELAKFPKEERPGVLLEASRECENGKPTPKKIREVGERRCKPTVSNTTPAESSPPAPNVHSTDFVGSPAATGGQPSSGMGGADLMTPKEFLNAKSLLSLQELSDKAVRAYNIFSNSVHKKEFAQLLWELKEYLPLYAKWETTVLNANQESEAA